MLTILHSGSREMAQQIIMAFIPAWKPVFKPVLRPSIKKRPPVPGASKQWRAETETFLKLSLR